MSSGMPCNRERPPAPRSCRAPGWGAARGALGQLFSQNENHSAMIESRAHARSSYSREVSQTLNFARKERKKGNKTASARKTMSSPPLRGIADCQWPWCMLTYRQVMALLLGDGGVRDRLGDTGQAGTALCWAVRPASRVAYRVVKERGSRHAWAR